MTDTEKRRECPMCTMPCKRNELGFCSLCDTLMCDDCFNDHMQEEMEHQTGISDEFWEGLIPE